MSEVLHDDQKLVQSFDYFDYFDGRRGKREELG